PRKGEHRGHGDRDKQEQRVACRRPFAPDAPRQGHLARLAVRPDVPQVVDHEQGAGQQPRRHRRRQPQPAQLPHLHKGRPGHRRDAEENEYRDLAEPAVPVRPRPAGPKPAPPTPRTPAARPAAPPPATPPRRHPPPPGACPRGAAPPRPRKTPTAPPPRPAESEPRTPSL